MRRKINIAIDGYSSTGKSTLARDLARELAYTYIDTGAMYRAITWYAMDQGFFEAELDRKSLIARLKDLELRFADPDDQGRAGIMLNDKLLGEELRSMAVAERVSRVAEVSEVRAFLVDQQRRMAREKAVVMDGRDIGSVVLPDAELKIFVTADPEIRVDRRWRELSQKQGTKVSREEVRRNLKLRDKMDTERADSPLVQADDARLLDNSSLDRKQQLELALSWVDEILA